MCICILHPLLFEIARYVTYIRHMVINETYTSHLMKLTTNKQHGIQLHLVRVPCVADYFGPKGYQEKGRFFPSAFQWGGGSGDQGRQHFSPKIRVWASLVGPFDGSSFYFVGCQSQSNMTCVCTYRRWQRGEATITQIHM
jgi:hypothetical protein